MSNWLVNGVAQILARTIVVNPMCNTLLEELQVAKSELEMERARNQRLVDASWDFHALMTALGDGASVVSVKIDKSVAGRELYEMAFFERLEALRCAITGQFHENKIDCTDDLDGETLWSFRRTHEPLN